MKIRNVIAQRLCIASYAVILGMAMQMGSVNARELIYEKNSIYNNIYVYKRGPLHILTFGHNRRFYTETIYDTRDERVLPVTYTRYMTVGLAYLNEIGRILEIGSGGGRTMWYLHRHMPELPITTVELDPAVYDIAKRFFGLRNEKNFDFRVKDGRRYLATNSQKWDIIFIDAYRGPFVPFHLLTKQFFELAKRRLNPGGVLVQNIEPSTMMFDSAISTIQRVFSNIDIYRADGNVVAVAYDGDFIPSSALLTASERLQKKYNFRYPLSNMLSGRRIVNKSIPGKILTDDFAPVESLLAIKNHNRKWDEFTKASPQ